MGCFASVEKLARSAADAATRLEHSGGDFVASAMDLLSDDRLVQSIEPAELLDALPQTRPPWAESQVPTDFSDLQLILYADDRVEVQLLYWLTATTSIHNHGFDGAFRVLAGRSIHSRFGFEPCTADGAGFFLGELSMLDSELLEPGAVRPIRAGFETIHSVYHLGFPSVTLLIATPRTRPKAATFEFRGRAVAVDRSQTDLFTVRQVQALRLLARTGQPLVERFAAWARANGPGAAYWGLRALDSEIAQLDDQARRGLEGIFAADPCLSRVMEAVRREKIIARLVNLRAAISDESARLVLSLFMNVPDPRAWPPMAAKFFGSEPGLRARVERAVGTVLAAPSWAAVGTGSARRELAHLLTGVLAPDTGGQQPPPVQVAALRAHPLAEFIGLSTEAERPLGRAAA